MVDAGLIVLVSFISPFRSERRMARELMQPGEFLEVFVDTPLAVAEKRDAKGLYKKARRGELKNFTGIDSPYEAPEHPEIHLRTVLQSPEEAAEQILKTLRDGGMLYPADELSGLVHVVGRRKTASPMWLRSRGARAMRSSACTVSSSK